MVNVGLVGIGYWGPNILRNLLAHGHVNVRWVCDSRRDMLLACRRLCPGIMADSDYESCLDEYPVDAVVICTPTVTHYQLALTALRAGCSVLVEKPLTHNLEEAVRLAEEAEKRRLQLLVDHTYLFHPAVRQVKSLLEQGELGGRLLYFDSTRVNMGPIRRDVSALWDLAAHDVAIMNYLLPGRPVSVAATGASYIEGRPENMAFITCFYPDDLIAHINVNWIYPVKVRQMAIGGDERMLLYNDLDRDNKIKVYDKSVTAAMASTAVMQAGGQERSWSPAADSTEPLALMVDEFVRSLQGKMVFPSGTETALEVMRVLEAAEKSLRLKGRPVDL